MPLKDVSIDEALYRKVKAEAHKRGLSIRAFVEEILNSTLKGDYADEKQVSQWKQIAVRYPATCIFCGKTVNKGEIAMWAKGVGIAHLSCFLQKTIDLKGDKELAKKYVKIRELQKTIEGLKKEADELADIVLTSRVIEDINKFSKKLVELTDQMLKFINDYGNDETIRLMEELYNETRELRIMAKEILNKLGIIRHRREAARTVAI